MKVFAIFLHFAVFQFINVLAGQTSKLLQHFQKSILDYNGSGCKDEFVQC